MDRAYIRMSRGDESGFTMLEILASIAIMAITILPLLGLLASAPKLHDHREQQTRAAFLAQQKLEEVKQQITTNFGVSYDKTDCSDEDFPVPDAGFRYTILDNENDDIKTITVTVWYDENGNDTHDGDEQKFELSTKVARRR